MASLSKTIGTARANHAVQAALTLFSLLFGMPPRHGSCAESAQNLEFDVVIAGGSTAAFAAAIASAESGARTALLEPTDWVGGQLTSSGVPAVDEAWHKIRDKRSHELLIDVADVARDPANMTPNFLAALQAIEEPGDCWVSRFCFCPDNFLKSQLLPMQRKADGRLTVFLNTVVKHVELDESGTRIRSITAIERMPKPGLAANGYDVLPSQDLRDWYSPHPSHRFDKRVVEFASQNRGEQRTVFIDATEWGEVLALSGVPYLQGTENEDGGLQGDDTCGQATVFCLVQEFREQQADETTPDFKLDDLGFGSYRDQPDAWEKIWTYRRIRGHGAPAPADLCLQNWGYDLQLREGGNDYPFGYLFKSRDAAARERNDWQGGVDLDVMAAAEQRALAWHHWFKMHAPAGISPRQIHLNSHVLGTAHGLAKLPYIRDTRRSIGLDGFILRFADLSGPVAERTGTPFDDRIALGAYPADMHPLAGCTYPDYILDEHETLPFFIPFRALTNDRLDNLLVAGKTMAQSFLANSATRLHPIEWSTGTAAGVAAAYMASSGKNSREVYEKIHELQPLIRQHTPIEWTIAKRTYPEQSATDK
jgi:hypothetical protein